MDREAQLGKVKGSEGLRTQAEISLIDYFEEVTTCLNPEDEDISSAVNDIVSQSFKEQRFSEDYCVLSLQVGQELVKGGGQLFEAGLRPMAAKYFQVATECFQFAMEEEDPYHPNQWIYAQSFSSAMTDFLNTKGDKLNDDDKTWLESKHLIAAQAQSCITHFLNVNIYRTHYLHNAMKNITEIQVPQDHNLKSGMLAQAKAQAEELAQRLSVL